jgi:hypothetical protein
MNRRCKECGGPIDEDKRLDSEFCRSTCKARFWRKNNPDKSQKLSTSKIAPDSQINPASEELSKSLRGITEHTVDPEVSAETAEPALPENSAEPTVEERIIRATQKRTDLNSQLQKLSGEITGYENDLKELNDEKTERLISRFLFLTPQQRQQKREEIIPKLDSVRKQHSGILTQWTEALFLLINLEEQKKKQPVKPDPAPVKKDKPEQKSGSGKQPIPQNSSSKIISSKDLKDKTFACLNFSGKWFEFIGKPAVVFHAAVHGKPGEGKSNFCFQFAFYLAENFGRVVYISAEEGFSKTLHDKLVANNAESVSLSFADLRSFEEIKQEVKRNDFHFIFIDSLDTLKIDAGKLKELREHYPNSAFITISQSTKDGKMRGSQEIIHDSDIAIRVENGFAITQKNRFKEKGKSYQVFSDPPPPEKPIEPPRNIV